jgi:hypothetical protein
MSAIFHIRKLDRIVEELLEWCRGTSGQKAVLPQLVGNGTDRFLHSQNRTDTLHFPGPRLSFTQPRELRMFPMDT